MGKMLDTVLILGIFLFGLYEIYNAIWLSPPSVVDKSALGVGVTFLACAYVVYKVYHDHYNNP
jgi:hypothetical protein